jgi:hypothetical protein
MSGARIIGSAIRFYGRRFRSLPNQRGSRVSSRIRSSEFSSRIRSSEFGSALNDVAHMGLRESSDRREQFVMGERWNPICHQSIQPQFSLIWLKTKSSY